MTPLIGRSRELGQLSGLVETASTAELAVGFVDGDAGSGKTRLLDELTGQVNTLGGLALRGSAPPPAGAAMPFAAISHLLQGTLRALPDQDRELIVTSTPELAHLDPSWRGIAAAPLSGTSMTILCARFAQMVERLSRDRPVVAVLLDDLQWADIATLDVVSFLLRSPREMRVVVVLAARLDDLEADAPLRRLRAEILRQGAGVVRLGPLDDREVVEYLHALGADALPAPTFRRVVRLGGGNPLFLRELAATGGSGAVLPESIRELVANRLGRLAEVERDILRIAAVVDDRVSSELVVQVAGRPPPVVHAALRRLIDSHILEAADGLVRIDVPALGQVVREGLLDGERRRLHGAIARAAAADPQLVPLPEAQRLLRLAHHWQQAGDSVRAFPALVRAAEAAERSFAFATSFALYRSALQALEPSQSEVRSIGFQPPVVGAATSDLRRRAADTAVLAGEPALAIEWLDTAIAEVASPSERRHLMVARARALLAAGDANAAVDAYRDTIGQLEDEAGLAGAQVGLARALTAAGRPAEAVPIATEALAGARATRSKTWEEAALLALGAALASTGEVVVGMQRLQEARALHAAPSSESALRPRISRVIDLTAGLADAAQAIHGAGLVADGVALAGETSITAANWGADAELARTQLVEVAGRVDRGEWAVAFAGLDALGDHATLGISALTLRARLGAWRGAWERAAADLARCEDVALVRGRPEDRASFSIALVELRLARREPGNAIDAATEGLLQVGAAPIHDQLELTLLAVRAHVEQALAAHTVHSVTEGSIHRDLATALGDQVQRLAGAKAPPRAVAQRAAAAAELTRLDRGDVDAWGVARGAWDDVPSAWWRAYSGFREAEALLARQGLRERAKASLVSAGALARELEAAPLVAEIEVLAVRARIDLPTGDPASAPTKAAPRLPISERELEVLVLISRGLTNREIAATLFISERTAAHHVSHIFDKLGVSSRVEAAGVAHQAGVITETARS